MAAELEAIRKAEHRTRSELLREAIRRYIAGDAELVICCDYVKAGDHTGGQIKMTGAIDKPLVKEESTLVTEGAKDAFKLRMENPDSRYGSALAGIRRSEASSSENAGYERRLSSPPTRSVKIGATAHVSATSARLL